MTYEYTLSLYSPNGPVNPVSTTDRHALSVLMDKHFEAYDPLAPTTGLEYEHNRLMALLKHTDEELEILCSRPDIRGLALSNTHNGLQLHVNRIGDE